MKPGPLNLITDVPGLKVGNAEDHHIKSGTTVLTADKPFCVSVDVMGGAPGTRETDLLAPDKMVAEIDALVLSGGSAFGLDAASGAVDALRHKKRGLPVGPARVPIVPAAIIFDLINGGDKDWDANPYPALGRKAYDSAAKTFSLGTAGAGTGAITAGLKGGLGSASLELDEGICVGALVAANPTGAVTMGDSPNFWASAFELGNEFGGLGPHRGQLDLAETFRTKRSIMEEMAQSQMGNTTIAIVATNAALDKAQLKRMATASQDGMARAISPAHTPVDGDLVFAMSTGEVTPSDPLAMVEIGHAASICLSRAIARSVYEATAAPNDPFPTWKARFGG